MTYDQVLDVVERLLSYITDMAVIAVVVAIVYYGVRMATAGGNPTAFNEAKKGLGLAAVGALLIFGVYTIIATVNYAVNMLGGR